jgi:hypothetical protein
MRVIVRPEIKVIAVPCVVCSKKTRSHVLELPEYEEIDIVIEDGHLEEYQGRSKKGEEEPEVITTYDRLTDPVCMCHGCWVIKKQTAVKTLMSKKGDWLESPGTNMKRISVFLESWLYYNFNRELAPDIKATIKEVRMALKGEVK